MVRDYLSLAGPWLYSTEEVCHAKHPQCCIACSLCKDQQLNQKQKGCAKSRESMNVQPITNIWLLFFFTFFLYWCSICLKLLAMKMASLREGGCLADIRGDSSFRLLTRPIYCWMCAYTPAMLLHPHSWAWICALPAQSQCVPTMAWLPTLVPMQQDGTAPAHRGGKPISQGDRWALEIDFDLHSAQCCLCQFPSWNWLIFNCNFKKKILSLINLKVNYCQ